MAEPNWVPVAGEPPAPYNSTSMRCWIKRHGCWSQCEGRWSSTFGATGWGAWMRCTQPAHVVFFDMLGEQPTHWAPMDDSVVIFASEMSDAEREALGKTIMDITREMFR